MNDRMTLTDIARHIGKSRPTTYKIVRSFGFPPPGDDKRWARPAVMDWFDRNTAAGASIVGGVLVRSVGEPAE